jgi:hypothetical protein
MKSATMADLDLTLSGAQRLIGTAGGNNGGGQKNTSDTYDKVEEKLIEKLKRLNPEAAEAAVKETTTKLNKTLKDIKQIADNTMKKAA